MGEEFDIDLGVYFCWQGQPEVGPHDAAHLREKTQASLVAFEATNTDARRVAIPPKPRCSRIHYDGDFHIDVPSYHLDPEADERTLATSDGWEISDPKALYVWFKGKFSDDARPRVRRLVRYLKCWAGLKWPIGDGRPSSVLLTVIVADAYACLADEEIGSDDDTLLALLRQISKRLKRGSRIRNPVNASENLNRLTDMQWNAFCSGVSEFVDIAQRACAADNELEAADEWSKAFAHFFPMPDPVSTEVAINVAKSKALVPIMMPDVVVTAVARSNSNLRYSGRNSIGPIPKDCDIRFEIVEPWKLPTGTTVEWMVRNEGTEAENVNDLGHRRGTDYTADERSAYVGKHFMDCILRYQGRVYSVRRVPVVITGIRAPRRNPLKQPAYAYLTGRR
jgi:hypothetical protein